MREISKDKLITPNILTSRFRVSCSLAKKLLMDLSDRKLIKKIKISAKETLYTKFD